MLQPLCGAISLLWFMVLVYRALLKKGGLMKRTELIALNTSEGAALSS